MCSAGTRRIGYVAGVMVIAAAFLAVAYMGSTRRDSVQQALEVARDAITRGLSIVTEKPSPKPMP